MNTTTDMDERIAHLEVARQFIKEMADIIGAVSPNEHSRKFRAALKGSGAVANEPVVECSASRSRGGLTSCLSAPQPSLHTKGRVSFRKLVTRRTPWPSHWNSTSTPSWAAITP
jgi:hypothetical protein